MKEKTRKKMKVVIIVIAVVAALIFVLAIYFIIGMSQFYDKSELRIRIENYVDEYNRSCDADKQVKIDHYYESGPRVHCDLKFSKETSSDEEAIIDFFLTFHNDFGYDNFCDAEINSEFFRRYDEVYFDLENIRTAYGDNKALPDPLNLGASPEDIDVTIYGVDRIIYFDPDTIGKFKGKVYAFRSNTDQV